LKNVDLTDGVTDPDGAEVPPFLSAATDPTNGYDFLVATSQAHVYVWIDATDPAGPYINFNHTLAGDLAGWSSTTGWDAGRYILLGWIDTLTDVATKQAHIRQLVRADLPEYFKTSTCVGGVWKTIRLPARLIT